MRKDRSTINGIQTTIKVGTPQDGTWIVSAQIEVDPRGKAFIPKLGSQFQSRNKAKTEAMKLMLGLNSEQMIRQFILGQAKLYDSDLETISDVKQSLTK